MIYQVSDMVKLVPEVCNDRDGATDEAVQVDRERIADARIRTSPWPQSEFDPGVVRSFQLGTSNFHYNSNSRRILERVVRKFTDFPCLFSGGNKQLFPFLACSDHGRLLLIMDRIARLTAQLKLRQPNLPDEDFSTFERENVESLGVPLPSQSDDEDTQPEEGDLGGLNVPRRFDEPVDGFSQGNLEITESEIGKFTSCILLLINLFRSRFPS